MTSETNKYILCVYKTNKSQKPVFEIEINLSDYERVIRRIMEALSQSSDATTRAASPPPSQKDLESITILEPAVAPSSSDMLENDDIRFLNKDGAIGDEISIYLEGNSPDQLPDITFPAESSELIMENQMRNIYRIIMRKSAFEKINEHAREDTRFEAGGVLVGNFRKDKDGIMNVVVTGHVRATKAERRTTSVNFSPEAWADIWRTIDHDPWYSDDQKWSIVGWYHTHPRFGIFLSSFDLFIQEKFFTMPGHIALVVDPVNKTYGYFGWNETQTRTIQWDKENHVELMDDRKLLEYLRVDLKLDIEQLPSAGPQASNVEIDGVHTKEQKELPSTSDPLLDEIDQGQEIVDGHAELVHCTPTVEAKTTETPDALGLENIDEKKCNGAGEVTGLASESTHPESIMHEVGQLVEGDEPSSAGATKLVTDQVENGHFD